MEEKKEVDEEEEMEGKSKKKLRNNIVEIYKDQTSWIIC